MGGLYCGIDIGSTNIKVLIVDEEGNDLWVRSVPSPRRNDGIGVVTDGLELVAALEALLLAGWRDVAKGKPFAALATAGIGEDGFCVSSDMRPRGLAIPWFDRRDAAEAQRLSNSAAGKAHPEINFAFTSAAAKWLWLRQHRPSELAGNDPWVALADFPAAWWTRRPFMSATLQPRTGVFDVFTRQWIPALLAEAQAPVLPPGIAAGGVVGTLQQPELIAAGVADRNTLIVSGGHDHPIATSAVMRLEPKARIDSIGTANAMLGETEHPAPGAAKAGIDLTLPARGGPGIAALGPIEFTVPMLKAFGSEDAIRAVLDLPAIPGQPSLRAPTIADALAAPDPARHRQVIEAVSLEARRFLEAMARVGIARGPIYAMGGWTRSRALMELRASMFGETITAVHEPELTALGAALFAIEAATGACPDFMRHRAKETIAPRKDWMDVYAAWT